MLDRVFGGEVLRHRGTKVVQGEMVPVGNDLGFACAFTNVLERSVAIEDGLQIDVSPPSEQDRFGVMIESRPLRAGGKCSREPDSTSST